MLRIVSLSMLAGFSLLLLLGNKNGRASQAQKGNTGAPGDETAGGQPRTCQACHNQGPITASLAISVLDSAGASVTKYSPGKSYVVRVTITASGPDLKGYGFQMIGLRDNGNVDLDGFTDVNPNNYKIVTIPGGRTYAEHDNISLANTFEVKWTAPTAGTGNITFYSAGNGVNSNGTTSGDGAGVTSLKLTEATTSRVEDADLTWAKMAIQPNPVRQEATLYLENLEAGDYRATAFDASGQVVWSGQQTFSAGSASLALPTNNWAPGVYYLRIEKEGRRRSVKVLKL